MKVNDKKMRDVIVELVKLDPSLADDDKKLIATVWWFQGWKDKHLYKRLKMVSSPETIRRTRAKLVEEGIIKPSAKAQKARNEEESRAREDLGY